MFGNAVPRLGRAGLGAIHGPAELEGSGANLPPPGWVFVH